LQSVLTGFAMVGVSQTPLTTPWILTSIVLVLVVFAVAMFGYTPTLRSQIAALDHAGAGSLEYVALATRGRRIGAILGVLVVAIVMLMVVKPTLWGD
jgi:uncharacterized membrane protein